MTQIPLALVYDLIVRESRIALLSPRRNGLGMGGAKARDSRRSRLLLASSSLAALMIGGGAPSAFAACAINDVGVAVGPVSNSSAINCIVIQNSTVAGDVTNTGTGTITATTPPSNVGVTINNSAINGAVVNAGHITATGQGIDVSNNAMIAGGITNTGTIAAALGNDIFLTGISSFAGGISNAGLLTGTGGIALQIAGVTTFTGGISNSGTITGEGIGIVVQGAGSFAGGVSNSGQVTVGNTAIRVGGGTSITASNFSGGVANSGAITANTAGLRVSGVSTFAGGVSNGGSITIGFGDGIDVGRFSGSTITVSSFTGGVTNSGTITAGRAGIEVAHVGTFSGGITNANVVSASHFGISIGAVATFAGGISNAGTITATDTSILLSGTTTFTGGITNTGTIAVAVAGIDILLTSVSSFAGGISNAGLITGTGGIGLEIAGVTTFTGGISNSGTISGDGIGIVVQSAGSFAGGVSNSGQVTVGNTAIRVGAGASILVSNFSGGVANSGAITANTAGLRVSGVSTFAGGVSNGGSLTIGFGDGIDVGRLTGAVVTVSSFTGGVTNTGTISAGRAGILVAHVGNFNSGVTNTGLVTATHIGVLIGAVSTFAGSISNSGTIVGATGILVQSGASFAGAAIVNTGIITGTTAAIDVSAATSAVTIDQAAGTIGGAINLSANADVLNVTGGAINGNVVGQGSADTINFALGTRTFTYASGFGFSGINQVNVASGMVVLDGTNSATAVAVNGGVLQIGDAANPGATLTGAVDVIGGTLEGHGTVIGGVTIETGGTLSPGGSIGTLTINGGPLTFKAGSTYAIQIAPGAGNNSSTAVNGGGAVISGGTVVVTPLVQGHYATDYVILTTTGGVTGRFAGVTAGAFAGSLTLDYTTIPGDVLLDVNGFAFASLAGASRNQQNVFNGIAAGGALATLPVQFQNLSALSSPALLNDLTQLSGEAAADADKGAFQFMTEFLGLMLDPFVDGRGDPGGGALGFAPEQPHSLPPDVALAYAGALKAPPTSTFAQRWSVWGAAFGGYGKTNGDPTVVGSHDTSVRDYGFAAGMDYRMSPDTVVGFALAGGGTNWGLAQELGGGNSDTAAAGVYGVSHIGRAYVGGSFAYANHWMTTSRFAPGDQLTARFDGESYGARLEGGYRLAAIGFGVTPYAAMQAQAFHTPGYSETDLGGGGFGLTYTAMNATDMRGELGARVDHRTTIADMPLTLRARAAWAHDWITDPAIGAVFQALPGSSFIVNGAAPPRDSALVSGGAELRVRPDWTLGARFDGELAAGAPTYSGIGTLKYSW